MANTTVTHQPGITSQKEYSGSVQYIGGYEGPYLDDGDVFVHQGNGAANEVPIPMAWWGRMDFTVDDGVGNQLFNVKEIQTLSGCLQALLGQSRPFYMKVINSATNNWIMELEHPASCACPALCPWAGPEMTVRMPTGEVLGHIKHAARETCGSWLGPSFYFDVYNYEGNLIYKVLGPSGYPCECTRNSSAVFKIMKEGSQSESGGTQVGEITHSWRGCCGGFCSCCITGDPDLVTMSFPLSLSAEDKALFLGLLFIVVSTQ
ncbi:hypothetical protein OS493_039147 [Desmophyllum pertusum]|uniref:Phospholipid scramblase n=1 Tax=Desmophyllum pertusum TaxID=174260 RepID=A0A9W9YHE2_9CNID|nr:hypothetical protein OS493_039147 [Desmophyllum pertusum]